MFRRLLRVRRSAFRGTGLVLVILVSSLILTVGLALGTLCTLNLNFAHQDLSNNQFRQMAKAGMQQVQAIMTQRGGLKIGVPDPSQPTTSIPPLLATLIPPTLFDESAGFPGKCEVTFDPSAPYYSYDNTQSELAATGFHGRTVPPFSVDLLLNMTMGSMTRHYETILTQRWQYDAFCGSGPVVVSNAIVQGSVFSNQPAAAGALVNIGNGIPVPPSPSGPPPLFPPSPTIAPPSPPPLPPASVTGDAGVEVSLDPLAIVATPPSLLGRKEYGLNLVNLPPGTSPATYMTPSDYTKYATPAMPGAPGNLHQPPPPPPPNSGLLDLSAIENSAYMSVTVTETSTATATCGTITTDVNSVTNYYVWLPDLHGTTLPGPEIINDAVNHRLYFMTGNVTVAPDATGNNSYAVDGCLFNHAYLYLCPVNPLTVTPAQLSEFTLTPTGVETTGAGILNITNASLFITDDGDFTDMQGTNAALYMGGSLRLNGGNLNANDKGMVITANGVSLTCGGNFHGFIASTQDILISTPTPQEGEPVHYNPLTMTGGLICNSGTLRVDDATNIQYGPQYTKVLNQFANVQMAMFREVSY